MAILTKQCYYQHHRETISDDMRSAFTYSLE